MKKQIKSIIYGCYPSFMSLYFINLLVIKHKIPIQTILISTKILTINQKKIKGLRGLIFFIKRFGIYFSFYQFYLALLLPFFIRLKEFFYKKSKIHSFKFLSQKYGIELIYTENFNSKVIINKISELNPSIFISMGLDQILKEKFIKLFKKACLNIHPSKLPDFRGPDSIFQFLLSNEKKMGITLHEINTEIDKGDILNIKLINREPNNTHFCLLKKAVEEGSNLFIEYFKGKLKKSVLQNAENMQYAYHSWPTKSQIKEFKKRNQKYFKLK